MGRLTSNHNEVTTLSSTNSIIVSTRLMEAYNWNGMQSIYEAFVVVIITALRHDL